MAPGIMNKKLVAIALLAISVIVLAGGNANYFGKPDFVKDAETRLGSNISNYIGYTACKGVQVSEQRWDITCLNSNKNRDFIYAVYPAEKSPYEVSRSFYLEALNDNARLTADKGLMHYLKINTETPLSKS